MYSMASTDNLLPAAVQPYRRKQSGARGIKQTSSPSFCWNELEIMKGLLCIFVVGIGVGDSGLGRAGPGWGLILQTRIVSFLHT